MDTDNVERFEFRALGGADTINIGDMTGTDVTRIDLDLRGHTDFERDVWLKALEIPRGEVRPYAWVAAEIGKPLAKRALFRPTGRLVANDRCNDPAAVRQVHQGDGECDGQGASVLVQGRDPQHLAAVARLAGLHDATISLPMPLPKTLGDDEIEALAERLLRRIAEQRFGPRVPEPDHAFAIGEDQGIGALLHHAFVKIHEASSRPFTRSSSVKRPRVSSASSAGSPSKSAASASKRSTQ